MGWNTFLLFHTEKRLTGDIALRNKDRKKVMDDLINDEDEEQE